MSGAIAAVDLGASSGRVIVGEVRDGQLRTRHVARFGNEPVQLGDGLHWNVAELYRQILLGLVAAERGFPGEIASLGVCSWAVDYGLLRDGRLLGIPFHYRDGRNEAGVEAVHARIGAADLYARNGLQHLPFNTLFQLATETELLDVADTMLLIPDLIGHWLTGRSVAERTNASTTGLLDPRTRAWDLELAELASVPARLLPPLVDAGERLGRTTGAVTRLVGRELEVVAVGSHDTASAVVAVPNPGRGFAYISCGTWGLVGLELDAPVLSDDARRANFTNEGGVDGRNRFLTNVMGTWLLSETLRHWAPAATDAERSSTLSELLSEAAGLPGPVPVFDVDDPRFLPPGDMAGRIGEWFRERGEQGPQDRAELVRSIVESIAAAFASAVTDACRLADEEVKVIHIVGGGSQNSLLCQATADRAGLPVIAGPVEATAMGNLLVQARAQGQVTASLEGLREIVARSFRLTRYDPR